MIFDTITLYNIFSYRGEHTFDFTPSADHPGNIAIIQGRNGQGKTSFINAVKLLFTGPAEELRRQVTTGKDRIPTYLQYIAGAEGWWGIMNAPAWERGERECWIRAQWTDDDLPVTAERRWSFDDKRQFSESVNVNAPFEGELADDPARDFLERALPRDFIPFFFFDGEEVRELAEGNNNQTIAKMELLLNIRPLDNLKFGLNELRKRWRSQAETEQRQGEFNHAQHRVAELDDQVEIAIKKLSELETDLGDVEGQLAQIERQLSIIQGGAHQEDKFRLEERARAIANARKELLIKVSEQFLRDALLRANPDLIDRVLETTEQCAHGEAAGQAELIATLKQFLPDVFSKPPHAQPPLTETQIGFYRRKLLKELDVYDIAAEHDGPFYLDPARARRLLAKLTPYASVALPAASLIRDIDKLGSLGSEIADMEKRLANVAHLSNARQAEYQRLVEAKATTTEHKLDLDTDKRTVESELRQLRESRTKAADAMEAAAGELDKSRAIRKRVDLIRRLLAATDRVKRVLKERKRHELEGAYNRHLGKLLDSNSLIHRVCIDGDFVISYRDIADQVIPMGSISAGMKQLSAMSLLWGLKDASGRDIPILIDTPLGRIDLPHQVNLLHNYYPNVGGQVIVLPTDSELTPEKYALIAPHVYRRYELVNQTGKDTQVAEIRLSHDAEKEGAHG